MGWNRGPHDLLRMLRKVLKLYLKTILPRGLIWTQKHYYLFNL